MRWRVLRVGRIPLPFVLLGIAFVAVAAWTWSWPDHPLIPDEAFARAMADHVRTNGTPFAPERIKDYADGVFAVDRYGVHYLDHVINRPATSIAAAYEQGVAGAKVGRLFTLALGVSAVAYLGRRLGGDRCAFFAGALFLSHPAILYFHQTYFSNPGGTAWFLTSVALLEASRKRPWLATMSALAGAIAVVFRAEYAMGMVVLAGVAWLVLRSGPPVIRYYSTVGLLLLALWNIDILLPSVTNEQLFKHELPIVSLLNDPLIFADVVTGTHYGRAAPSWGNFVANAADAFVLFFPLWGLLGLLGVFGRLRSRPAVWVLFPISAQVLIEGYAVMPSLVGFDFSGTHWLESSMVRFFLLSYAVTALLAAMAIERLAEGFLRLPIRVRPRMVIASALAVLIAGSSIASAIQAEHGIGWANERRVWFDAIDHAAAGFGDRAVFVGGTPSKVILSRPVLHPINIGYNGNYATFVAIDIVTKGGRVFSLEPWYWSDDDPEALLLSGGHTYWTDTAVQVNCTCGEFARFYELHFTNASLRNVARFEVGSFRDDSAGIRTDAERSLYYPERNLHIAMGLAQTLHGVNVTLTIRDEGNATYDIGYWNLPLDNPKNSHQGASWQSTNTSKTRTVSFEIPPDEIMNGALYIRGPPGLLVEKLEVAPK